MKKKLWIFMLFTLVLGFWFGNGTAYASQNLQTVSSNCMYLSDMSYIEDMSFAAEKHSIRLDENEDNGMITVRIDDTATPFIKGVCAWATSQIVYDLSNCSYDYFTTYVGVDNSEQNDYFNTGVVFYIYTSEDGENWEEKYCSETLKGWDNAEYVKVDINNAAYLKLVADDNSDSSWANWYDEAVFADAKLITKDYTEDIENLDFIKTVAEYDAMISEHFGEEISGDYELLLLQREFVNNVGYDILQSLVKYKTEYKDTVSWLMNDKETLKLYLVGGKPEGSYLNSVKVLTELYTTYKEDLFNQNQTEYGTTYGDLYRTMMLALSLTESGNVYLWIDGVCHSDALTRYEIYKNLHLHEGKSIELIENKIFESLTVEEMRWVMNTVIDDEEIVWLNDYVRNEGEGKISPYNYITYTFDYDYSLDKYYSQENYNTWNEKYHLSDYNITYAKGQPKLWIVFEEGSVCGGLSKTGSCIWGAFKGLPNTCISQPGHCAYIYYTHDENGNVKWELGNNVSGWGLSGKTEHLNVRTMNDWGNGSYTTGWNANYILLAQAAQNEYETYEKAEEILMLANVYPTDNQKLETIYRKALETEALNFDAWLGLIEVYEKDTAKTEQDYYNLAQEIVQVYTYYPYPMNDLLNLIKPHITSLEYDTMFTLLRNKALTTASKATQKESVQDLAVRQVADALLDNIDTDIALFSFDGENAGKLMLSDFYDGTDVAWAYSLDGGKTWSSPTEEHSVQLNEEELASITSENDIKVYIIGVDYTEENIFTIDITESEGLPVDLYANDLENKLIGATKAMQWKRQSDTAWTSFEKAEPDLNGDCTLEVRIAATKMSLAGTENKTFIFTKDNQPDTQKYISIKHFSIQEVSSQSGDNEQGAKVIDGNINTIWHTVYDGSDSDRTIILKLDEPVYLSALEYVPRQNGTNGRAKDVQLYTSTDGKNYTLAGSASDWANNAESKMLTLKDAVKTQYVKFVTINNHGDGRNFASAAMINLYEDVTKKITPTPQIQPSNSSLNSDKKVTAPKKATIKKVKSGKKKAVITLKKTSGAKGYRIQYSTNKKFKNAKNKYITKTTVTIKKLKSKKTYYFRVKAYKMDGKKKVYSKNWSTVKKVKIK